MLDILSNIIFFLITFICMFLFDLLFLCSKKTKKKRTYRLTSEGIYLIKRFDLDDKKVNIKKLDFHISIINAFIISFVSVTISLIKSNIIIEFSIGFVMLLLLIYSIYEIYGRYIEKEWKK